MAGKTHGNSLKGRCILVMIETKYHLFWPQKDKKSIKMYVQDARNRHKLVTQEILAEIGIFLSPQPENPKKYKGFR